ncbi:hypothetical protein EJB05_14595, partial [Eragrostis curvula]
HEKPFRFTPEQIAGFTSNYSTRLGVGGFGAVYKGALPNGLAVAVKVLHSSLDQRSGEEQFMAEVGTIGRTHHVNLLRLFGFCFDSAVRALVYEYMERGALDEFLLRWGRDVGLEALRAIAVGVARGIRYLHEECREKIVHYDIKPGNVLLDATLMPKVADFGLARLVNHAATHVTVSRPHGTPGFAAPEIWRQSGITEKCDVYSFDMLLFEIVGLRRNFDEAAPTESQRWFPKLPWTKYERGELMELVAEPSVSAVAAGDVARRKEMVERMFKVAFWCVQEQPEARPPIGVAVKMLEGEMDIAPPVNPFQHLMMSPIVMKPWTLTVTSDGSGNRASANVISDVIGVIIFLKIIACGCAIRYRRRTGATVLPDNRIRHLTIEKFIWEIRHEKPFRFTPEQIGGFTNNYSTQLGAGGFGAVFKGVLPNGLAVAVKVFHSSLDQTSGEEQFMAEVGTIGRTHHVNLVRLFGFCFDGAVRALVYEFMERGALDEFLLRWGCDVGLEALRAIAVGVARGIRYLHEECREKIVHYDIKPGNVLLDATLTPKVADFGLARLVNRADTHVTVSRPRGTPGFAAPEMWRQSGVTEKCDVYSFGMLLFEIVGL